MVFLYAVVIGLQSQLWSGESVYRSLQSDKRPNYGEIFSCFAGGFIAWEEQKCKAASIASNCC